jgi:catechol 2,3-dioxygenase-like lactoylglutathione lyase family enzyme
MALRIGMVTADCADPEALAAFWAAALQTKVVFEVEGFVMLAPPGEGGPALGFQRVPEERAGKNRLHLDLGAPQGGRAAEVARLVGLGATELGERGGDEYGLVWTTLTDPEGNEFCVGEH